MNAQRNDHRDDMSAPHDAVAKLVRATNEAMEALMKTDAKNDKEDSGLSLNPLMANPAVMMAAATAYGIRMTGQWATMFLNALQEQAEARDGNVSGQPDVREAETPAEVETETPAEVQAETRTGDKPEPDVAAVEAMTPAPVAKAKTKNAPAEPKRERKTTKVVRARKPETAAASSPDGDDLKQISGIGPKLVAVLASKGLTSFAALADMNEAALAALDAELGLEGRVLRDDWAGQARKIMASRT